ncbi:MAG: hypothetical protein ACRDTA_24770, partial [Pseudonocardiaceae bacterium]
SGTHQRRSQRVLTELFTKVQRLSRWPHLENFTGTEVSPCPRGGSISSDISSDQATTCAGSDDCYL